MEAWMSWAYHYGVGGLVFAGSLILATRAGALRLEHPPHRRLLLTLIGGLLATMAIHALWIARAG